MRADVGECNREVGLELPPELRVLDLVSGTGELSKALLKARDCGTDELGPDPGRALEASVEKYRERFAETGAVGSGE